MFAGTWVTVRVHPYHAVTHVWYVQATAFSKLQWTAACARAMDAAPPLLDDLWRLRRVAEVMN